MFSRIVNTDHHAHGPKASSNNARNQTVLDNRPITTSAQQKAAQTWSDFQSWTAHDTPAATHLLPPRCCGWCLLAAWTGSPQGSGRIPSGLPPSWLPHCPEQPADKWEGRGLRVGWELMASNGGQQLTIVSIASPISCNSSQHLQCHPKRYIQTYN